MKQLCLFFPLSLSLPPPLSFLLRSVLFFRTISCAGRLRLSLFSHTGILPFSSHGCVNLSRCPLHHRRREAACSFKVRNSTSTGTELRNPQPRTSLVQRLVHRRSPHASSRPSLSIARCERPSHSSIRLRHVDRATRPNTLRMCPRGATR